MKNRNHFVTRSSTGSYSRTSGPKSLDGTGRPTQVQKLLEREWQTVEGNIQDCREVWNRKRLAYSLGNTALIIVALVLSTFVIPIASYFEQSDISLFAGLAITGIIGFRKAFAIGERARFYRRITCELWALDQELEVARFDDVDDHEQLNNVSDALRELIENDSQKLPAGRELAAIQ